MRTWARFDRRSGEFIDPSVGGNPMLMAFGLTELAIPMIAGTLLSAGVGATTAGTIASIAAPSLISAGIGAAGSAAMGSDPGKGALFGALGGAFGPLGAAAGRGFSAPLGAELGGAWTGWGPGAAAAKGALNSVIGVPGENTAGMVPGADGALNTASQYGIGDGANGIVSTQGQLPDGGMGSSAIGSPLAQNSAGVGGGSQQIMGILSALARDSNRPSITAPQSATMNNPLNPSAYLNRAPVVNPGTPNSYYTYGSRAPAQFYTGNQFHVPGLAHGGALSQAMAARKMAQGGQPMFDSRRGDFSVGGQGSGQQDNIDAKLSPGEVVWDAGTVSAVGDGNSEEGARRLMQVRDQIAKDKGFAHNVQPKLKKSPLEYLRDVA